MIIKSLPIFSRMAFFGGRELVKACKEPFVVGECLSFVAENEFFDVRLSQYWTFVLEYAMFTGIVVCGQGVHTVPGSGMISSSPSKIFKEATMVEGYLQIRLNKGLIRVQ